MLMGFVYLGVGRGHHTAKQTVFLQPLITSHKPTERPLGFWRNQARASSPVRTIWSTLGRQSGGFCTAAFTLCTSCAAEQLRPSLQPRLHYVCMKHIVDTDTPSVPPFFFFFLHKMPISVQDTKILPVNTACRLARPIAPLVFRGKASTGSLWWLWGLQRARPCKWCGG